MRHMIELLLVKAILHGMHKRGYSCATSSLIAREAKRETAGWSWPELVLHAVRLTLALH